MKRPQESADRTTGDGHLNGGAAHSSASLVTGAADLRRLMGIDFSDQQIDAITAPLEPAVIVAGAGSGKTTVMAARVVWLVATGAVRADRILGLTFTNKAAAELSQRVRHYLALAGLARLPGSPGEEPDDLQEPTVLTYHAYAGRLLTEHGLRIGHEPDTRLMADASRFQLAARAIRQHRGPVHHLSTWVATSVNALLSLDSQLAEHLVRPRRLLEFQAAETPMWQQTRQTLDVAKTLETFDKRRELLGFIGAYRRLKSDLGLMDFSDQMSLAARLAESSPEVGAAERDKFRVVLLDEYQDTSVAQARLLTALFSDTARVPERDRVGEARRVTGLGVSDGRGHPVTAVGDPCQAIYGWRGASVSNIDRFPSDFPRALPAGHPDTVSGAEPAEGRRTVATTPPAVALASARYTLSVNRRSSARIIDVANDLAGALYASHQGVEPLLVRSGADDGVVRAAILETQQDELDFLAAEVPRAHMAMPSPIWSQIGVLVRDNAMAGAVHAALTAAGVPVEVIGLSGLLRTPEVSEIVATLDVLHDVTANASLLLLLAGPRWAVGVRDLALLGARANELAAAVDRPVTGISMALEQAVAGADPSDVTSLLEALEDPGPASYSAEARDRFGELVAELRGLRRHISEPLLDLVRRVIDVTSIDVELASSPSSVAASRRDNLSSFLDAVVSFAGVDGDASLSGLLAYLEAEEEYGQGLALALPTAADSVKLLTVHRAKGLEWDVVFLPGVCAKTFPPATGRRRWPTAMDELPSPLRGDRDDLPVIHERSSQGLKAYVSDCRAHESLEERRLAYVAVTRPRQQLVVSCHWWGREQKQPRGPSVFLRSVVDSMAAWGQTPEVEAPPPADDAENPANRALDSLDWPVDPTTGEVASRQRAAALVRAARARGWREAAEEADAGLALDERAVVEQWDAELARLIEEARSGQADEIAVPLPASLSATVLKRLRDDPDGLAAEIARPMPRRPSASARFGTRFHAWVESHVGQQQLLDPDDLPGRADTGIADDVELRRLEEAFAAGPFGSRRPLRVEAPFAVVLAGQVVRGRIDAVYETAAGFLVVDWKTQAAQTADPLQLAIYRLAWAELMGCDITKVEAAFYYVRSGDVVDFDDLPGRRALERLLRDDGSVAAERSSTVEHSPVDRLELPAVRRRLEHEA